MSTLIKAAQQALEALRCQNYDQKLEAIVALDYAIEQAQKQEPRQEAQIVNWNCPCGNTVTFRGFTQAPPPRQPLTDAQCEYCKRGLKTMCLCGIKGEA